MVMDKMHAGDKLEVSGTRNGEHDGLFVIRYITTPGQRYVGLKPKGFYARRLIQIDQGNQMPRGF